MEIHLSLCAIHLCALSDSRRARCPCRHLTASMCLQGGSSVRPNKRKSRAGLHASTEVWPRSGRGQDTVAPGGASCRLPISHPLHRGIRCCDTQGGETGHFEGYRPARNHGEVAKLERAERKEAFTTSCFCKKKKSLNGFICWPHLIPALPYSFWLCIVVCQPQ